ncbi:MAG: hypothetical protein AAF922_00185 [Pseudomonadota bacterium]
MTITHLLEDFARERAQQQSGVSQAILDEERLSSFEQGYQAGWDDSIKASSGEETKAMQFISKAVSDLSVSRQEIYTELLANLHPFFGNLIESALPMILKESLGVQIAELIHTHIEDYGHQDVVISVGEGQKELIDRVASRLKDLPIRFEIVSGLAATQVKIKFSDMDENEIDTFELVGQIKKSIDKFFADEVGTSKENV